MPVRASLNTPFVCTATPQVMVGSDGQVAAQLARQTEQLAAAVHSNSEQLREQKVRALRLHVGAHTLPCVRCEHHGYLLRCYIHA